jgi:type IV secretory pathway VirB2 component (pilin)
LLWDIAKGITSWSTCRRLHGKQGARERNGFRARRKAFLERVVGRGSPNGFGGGSLFPSWVGYIADGLAWSRPLGAGGDGYGVGFLGRDPVHAAESAGHNAAGPFGVVCDSAFMFRICCIGGLVRRQWSEWFLIVNLSKKGKNEMKLFRKRVEWGRLVAIAGLLTLASAVLSLPTFAAAGGQALPWEAPLTRLQQSLSGPVAGAIAIIALVAIGVTLVFGGEWNEFARRAVYAVCAIAFIISAGALLGGLFAVGAAVV